MHSDVRRRTISRYAGVPFSSIISGRQSELVRKGATNWNEDEIIFENNAIDINSKSLKMIRQRRHLVLYPITAVDVKRPYLTKKSLWQT